MREESSNNEERSVFSRFDLTVIGVVLLLIIGVVAVSLLGSPARRGAMVAYLYPLDAPTQNIWLAPLDNPAEARALTESRMGIYDFNTSADGRYIAYSERSEDTRLLDIYLIDLQTGTQRQLTNCGAESTECYTPVFHPDGRMIAFQRQSFSREAGGGAGVPRIWLLDILSGETRPLSDDSQMIGHSPQWARSGSAIAYYNPDLGNPSVMVYTFAQQDGSNPGLYAVPSRHGSVGTLSPNGRRLVYPDIVDRAGTFFTYLKIVDLDQEPPTFQNFTDPNAPTDDIAAQWHPDGQTVTIERRYLDERYTRGFQLYEMALDTDEITPLLVDEHYSHHYFEWSADGAWLVMQRLRLLNEDGSNAAQSRPEIWVLERASGELRLISEQAWNPRWVIPR